MWKMRRMSVWDEEKDGHAGWEGWNRWGGCGRKEMKVWRTRNKISRNWRERPMIEETEWKVWMWSSISSGSCPSGRCWAYSRGHQSSLLLKKLKFSAKVILGTSQMDRKRKWPKPEVTAVHFRRKLPFFFYFSPVLHVLIIFLISSVISPLCIELSFLALPMLFLFMSVSFSLLVLILLVLFSFFSA